MNYEEKKFTLKNGLTVTFKSPVKEDAARLLSFLREVSEESEFLLTTLEDLKEYTIIKEAMFIELSAYGNSLMIAVYHNKKIIGNGTITFNRNVKDRHRAEIGLAVKEEYANLGIGTLLMDEMIREAKEREEIEQIELLVFENNTKAIHLYQKMGFIETGKIPKAIKEKDGRYIDEIRMVLYLH